MNRRRSRAAQGIATITGGLAALLLAITPPAVAAPATLDDVYATLGIDQVPSDYVVMVDVSGSMNGARYAQVKKSLTGFFAALAPQDRVTLIPFAERAPATTQPVGHAPAQLIAKLPRNADGAYTDIGAALESGVKALSRPGAPPLATVVLLTDGLHDPGPHSAYPLTAGYGWNQLAATAAGLHKTSLQAYAIPLAGTTGASLLRKVFPSAKVLAPTSVDGLTAMLARPKQEARAAKARSILAVEAGRPVSVAWPAGAIGAGRSIVRVRVHSPMSHIPLVLDQLAVTAGNGRVTATVPGGAVQLPPGGTTTIPVSVDWDAGPRTVAPFRSVNDRVDLRLSARITSPWSTALTHDLGLPFGPALSAPSTSQPLSAQRGSLLYWIAVLVLLAALVVLLMRWRRSRLSPVLRGSLVIGSRLDEPRTVPLSGRRLLLSADVTGLPGSGEITAARDAVASSDVRLRIVYSPDGTAGSREAASCPPGQSVVVAGVPFTWQAAVPAQRGSSVPASP